MLRRRTTKPPIWAEVSATERLSPSLMRVVLTGGDLDRFEMTDHTDAYVNAQFFPADAPDIVPFVKRDVAGLPEHQRPRARRFTVRAWDPVTRRLTIDFAVHGDRGYAGPWAVRAVPGDRLQFTGPGGGYAPDPNASWYVLAGDESAIPAIAASLEAVPDGRHCVAMIVVDDADHEIAIDSGADLHLTWLHRRTAPEPERLLVGAMRDVEWRPGPVDVFVHGEAGEIRAVRTHLISHHGIDVTKASISPYWRRGADDEAWRAIKKQWLKDQEKDVGST